MSGTDQRPGSTTQLRVRTIENDQQSWRTDRLTTEEPLEIRLSAANSTQTVAVTMRTPGADFELAAGFLYGEGIIPTRDRIRRITYCADLPRDGAQQYNIVNVELAGGELPELGGLERHFYTSSACGVCGKAGLEALEVRDRPALPAGPVVHADVLYALPEKLTSAQSLFASTGGLHAAGLFTATGDLVAIREDVGRHNAVDKLVGWALLEDRLPLSDHLLMVSGRSSFEIMQKALVAGVPIVCAVSAPSSLAVSLAQRFAMTLVGFLRRGRCNVYAGQERVPSMGRRPE